MVSNRRFGTTYRSRLQGSSCPRKRTAWILKTGPRGSPEKWVWNHLLPRNDPEDGRIQFNGQPKSTIMFKIYLVFTLSQFACRKLHKTRLLYVWIHCSNYIYVSSKTIIPNTACRHLKRNSHNVNFYCNWPPFSYKTLIYILEFKIYISSPWRLKSGGWGGISPYRSFPLFRHW